MTDNVFVVKTTKYLERDLIVQTLSATSGKRSFLARGGQRSKKRFAGGMLETGNLLTVEYKPARNENGLATINEAKLVKSFDGARADYDKITFIFSIFKIIQVMEWEEQDCERLFSLLINTLCCVEEDLALDTLRFMFLLKILYLQGTMPINSVSMQWLKLDIKKSDEIVKTDEYFHYKKISEHLLKELTSKEL